MRLSCAALLAALALPGCAGDGGRGPAGPEAPPPELLAPLALGAVLGQPPDPAALAEAAAQLRRHLVHPAFGVREEATRALEGLGPPAVHLLALLHADADPELSWRVRRTLERLGWPCEELLALAAQGGAAAAPFVASALRERTVEKAFPAIVALARIGGPAAREAAGAVAADPEARARYHAARALGAIGDPRAIPLLERLRQDADQGVRFAAIGALRRLGREEDFQAFVAALEAASAGADGGGVYHLYNLSCLAALSGRAGEACDWMAKAYLKGFHDAAGTGADPDLYELREDPTWQRLLQMMARQGLPGP